ncbi:MAG: ABC transporter ATP-binding protein, partial [Verrucomicrobiales bacterium]|nr:ABC transporter ATP-binding protein [Verrucomicrobiales bacterium]
PEFMQFIADLFSMDHTLAANRTRELFAQFALDEHCGQRIENLSHGTLHPLAIASPLLHDPKVIVIDEPMVGLDPLHARTVKAELKRRSQNGTTVLMSTHLLNIAEELADRIGILKGGKLIALGTLAELRAQHEASGQRLEEIFLDMVSDEVAA